MLNALLKGEQDIEVLAQLARGRLRTKLPDLRAALQGQLLPHHRLLLTRILAHIDFLDQSLAQLQQEIEQRLAPFEEAVELLQTIPGVHQIAAMTIVAEIGTDMTRFPSAKHLASWAGLCPGNKQSGGKRQKAGITGGNPWLRAVLGEVVWSISHTKDNYLSAQYRRLARRRGAYKAVVAVAHSVLVIIYHMLHDKKAYDDLGGDYFDHLDAERVQRHHVRQLEQLGYTVTLAPTKIA